MTHCAINQLGSKTTRILISHQKSTLPGLVSLVSHLSDTDRCEAVGFSRCFRPVPKETNLETITLNHTFSDLTPRSLSCPTGSWLIIYSLLSGELRWKSPTHYHANPGALLQIGSAHHLSASELSSFPPPPVPLLLSPSFLLLLLLPRFAEALYVFRSGVRHTYWIYHCVDLVDLPPLPMIQRQTPKQSIIKVVRSMRTIPCSSQRRLYLTPARFLGPGKECTFVSYIQLEVDTHVSMREAADAATTTGDTPKPHHRRVTGTMTSHRH